MTSRQRSILALGSFLLSVLGIGLQFGVAWAAIVTGAVGVTVAVVLAVGAVK